MYQRCKNGLWDSTIPGIEFDEEGVSNYAKMFAKLTELYPRDERGANNWDEIVKKIKISGRRQKYDCVVGVSGGTDSSYLLYLAKEIYGLRPLALYLDNGWGSEKAVKNIQKMTDSLGIDLETYVVDYEEMKDLLRSYMYSSLPWIDIPTDLAIKSIMFKVARKEGIKFVLRGNDFRSEGFQPHEWTYGDGKQLKHIHKLYGKTKLKSFPNYTITDTLSDALFRGIKSYFPYYYLEYSKQDAQKFLSEKFAWEYYGGHHHENIFTKFAITYWLYEKFHIDKRIITLSAQVMSGVMSYHDAEIVLKSKPYDDRKISSEINYVIKKLEISQSDFRLIMDSPNKYYQDYPSYVSLFTRFAKPMRVISKLIYPYTPMSFIQSEFRK